MGIGAWETHQIKLEQKPDYEKVVHKIYHNASGDYDVAMINRTTKINVNGILIEYEGEDSGIGLLFASKAAVQIFVSPVPGEKIPLVRPTNRYKGKSGNPPVLNSGEGGSEGSLNYQWKNDTRSSW